MSNSPEPSWPQRFVTRLAALSRGDLAVLRRAAGVTIAESRAAAAVFYRLYPAGADPHDEELYFLVATLYGLNPSRFTGNFGATLRAMIGKKKSADDPLARRVVVLLDSQFDLVDGHKPGGGEMAYRMRHLVRQAAAKNVGVDWPRLLEDLHWWTHPAKRVQKAWARAFFSETHDENPAAATAATSR